MAYNLSRKEQQEFVEFVYQQRKKGISNSELRTQLHAKEITLSDISDIITEVDIRITTPSNTGIFNFIKKSHAKIRIVIGAVLFVTGITGAIYSYMMYEQLRAVYDFLFMGIAGLGVYSTGKFSLSKSKHPNKKFETSFTPIDK